MTEPTYLVRLSSGLVVKFTKAELDAMWAGTDPLAVKVLGSPSQDHSGAASERGLGGGGSA